MASPLLNLSTHNLLASVAPNTSGPILPVILPTNDAANMSAVVLSKVSNPFLMISKFSCIAGLIVPRLVISSALLGVMWTCLSFLTLSHSCNVLLEITPPHTCSNCPREPDNIFISKALPSACCISNVTAGGYCHTIRPPLSRTFLPNI